MKGNPKNILIGAAFLVIIVLVLGYRFGYSPNAEKAEQIEKENKTLEARKEELNQKMLNRPLYTEGIENSTKIIDAVLEKYGPGFKPEKTIMTLVDLCSATGAEVSSATFTDDAVIYENPGATAEDKPLNVLFSSRSTVSMTAGYTQFKKVVDFINSYPERINIDSFNLVYDEEGANLKVTMDMNLYGVSDENHVYVDPEVSDDIKLGTSNIFGVLTATEEEEEGLEGEDNTNVTTE